MTLDPFEEQLHLPPLLVDVGDGLRGYGEEVGQKHEAPMVLWGSPGFVDTPKGKGIIPWEVCHGGRTKEVHEGIQG
jgi:hypothetical protein